MEQKDRGNRVGALRPWCVWFSGLWGLTGTTPPVCLNLQLTDGRSRNLSDFHNHVSQSLLINPFLCIHFALFLWRTLISAYVKQQSRSPTSLPDLKPQSFIHTATVISFSFHGLQIGLETKYKCKHQNILESFG